MAACHAMRDEPDAAAAQAREVLKLSPGFTVKILLLSSPLKRDVDLAHLRDAIAKAGLPIGAA